MRFPKATRLLAALFAVTLVISCTDAPMAPPTPPPPAPQDGLVGGLLGGVTNLVGGLLKCSPMPFSSDAENVGPGGGILHMGPHYLVIPPGALSSTVRITATAPSDTVNSVRFGPEGLHFNKPVALVMDYSNCNLLAGLLTPKRIAYTTDALKVITYIPSVDAPLAHKVTGALDHFSRYAISW